jgi:hypothetical protein
MTANLQLWNWFSAAGQTGRRSTAQGLVTLWDASGKPRITFLLTDCLPVKLRGPSLNAKDGQIAIEEIQLVYASLKVKPASGVGSGGQITGLVSVSGGAGLSCGIGGSVIERLNIG